MTRAPNEGAAGGSGPAIFSRSADLRTGPERLSLGWLGGSAPNIFLSRKCARAGILERCGRIHESEGDSRMVSVKDEVASLLQRLPDDCSLEDIQYHLYVLEKVRRGLARADREGAIEQEEAEARLSKWLTE